MKKPIAIACVLLLLAVMVGLERFNCFNRSGPEAVTQTGLDVTNQRSGRRVGPTTHSETTSNLPVAPTFKPHTEVGADLEIVNVVVPQPRLTVIQAASGGGISEICYIRGRTILGSAEPDKESIARLQEAVGQVAVTVGPKVMIFDLDGLVTSQSVFLVYANPRFDLTNSVEAAYRVLKEVSAVASQAKKVEPIPASNGR